MKYNNFNDMIPNANITSRRLEWASIRENVSISGDRKVKEAKQFISFVRLIQSITPLLFPSVAENLIDGHLEFLLKMYQCRGKTYLVRFLKATVESFDTLVLATDSSNSFEKVSLGLDKDGWPKWLGSRLKRGCLAHISGSKNGLKSGSKNHNGINPSTVEERLKSGLLPENIELIRYVQTLCSSRRFITLPTTTDLSSITDFPTFKRGDSFDRLLDSLAEQVSSNDKRQIRSLEIGQDCYDTRGDSPVSYTVPKLKISLKSGPNGTSIYNFPFDRAAIMQDPLLKAKLLEFARIYYTGSVEEWINEKLSPYKTLLEDCTELYNVGKLALLHEGGKLKPRIVGIIDSFTQTLLGPLHDDMMALLRSIPDDCTFDHDKISATAKILESQGHRFYGFADLSNATDRIPQEAYREVGDELRDGLGTCWVGLFDRNFLLGPSVQKFFNNLKKPMPDSVVYNTGQPMGALSSWPFMAYLHHVIVWYCFGGRKNARGHYKILGDDIVIFNKKAYLKYLKTMDTLGIPYTNCISTIGFEFAKRVFIRGEEVTGAYTQALSSSRNSPELFALEWKNLYTRGYSAGEHFPVELIHLWPPRKRKPRFLNRALLLMAVPSGTNITAMDISKWTCNLLGRGTCNIDSWGESAYLEIVKTFKQIAALSIQRTFQKTLDTAKRDASENISTFTDHFNKYWEQCNAKHSSAIDAAIQEYKENQTLKVRFLEMDLKNVFLKSNLRLLLRPNLLDIPRPITMEVRDKHEAEVKFRAKHILDIINFMRIVE